MAHDCDGAIIVVPPGMHLAVRVTEAESVTANLGSVEKDRVDRNHELSPTACWNESAERT